jgi:hypothetical protein
MQSWLQNEGTDNFLSSVSLSIVRHAWLPLPGPVFFDNGAFAGFAGSAPANAAAVVSDERCDGLPESLEAPNLSDDGLKMVHAPCRPAASRLWDDFLLLQEKSNRGAAPPLSCPCTSDEAAAGLVDAAPIKVLLFRKMARLQRVGARR